MNAKLLEEAEVELERALLERRRLTVKLDAKIAALEQLLEAYRSPSTEEK